MADISSAEAVRAAAREFDALGDEAFRYEYDFEPTSDCAVVVDGGLHPAGALLGAAHGHQHPAIGPLSDSDLGGGRRLPRSCASSGLKSGGLGDDNEV